MLSDETLFRQQREYKINFRKCKEDRMSKNVGRFWFISYSVVLPLLTNQGISTVLMISNCTGPFIREFLTAWNLIFNFLAIIFKEAFGWWERYPLPYPVYYLTGVHIQSLFIKVVKSVWNFSICWCNFRNPPHL